jgi:hypothetical protein
MISIFGLVIVPLNKRLRDIYIKGDNEAVYAAYRHITGKDTKESWRYCKPLIRVWEGKK